MKNDYFKPAGNLTEQQKNIKMNEYFKPAGDLGQTTEISLKDQQELFIKNYLLEIVSGKHLEEEEIIIGGGSMIVSFSQLKNMVDEGCYNFIKAEYLNPEMIIVEYQKYQKENYIIK